MRKNNFRKFLPLYILIFLALVNISAWQAGSFDLKEDDNKLKVAFLDVGQGDAIYVEAPNGAQMVVDGGPGKKIMEELGRLMPPGDMTIDLIVVTNPDKDHLAGFIDVLDKYEVAKVLESGTKKDTIVYKKFKEMVKKEGMGEILARKGMQIFLDEGKGIYFEILFPDRDVSNWSTNDGSVVGKLVYGEKSFLLTGDATLKTENYLLASAVGLKSDVLKIGHHGSRTSTGDKFLEMVSPYYAIVSAGRDNSYGHPHKEVINRLEKYKIPILGTYEKGTVIFETDGFKLDLLSLK